jgi:hypothetical protein
LDCWIVGLLDCWIVGLLDCWIVGLLEVNIIPPFHHSIIPSFHSSKCIPIFKNLVLPFFKKNNYYLCRASRREKGNSRHVELNRCKCRQLISKPKTFFEKAISLNIISFMQSFKQWSFFLLLFLCSWSANSQELIAMGQVLDDLTSEPLQGVQVTVEGTRFGTVTDRQGQFVLRGIPGETPVLNFRMENYTVLSKSLNDLNGMVDLGIIRLIRKRGGMDELAPEDLIPTISLSESDLENDDPGVQNISGLLTATRDIFVSAAAFTFGPRRFRIRGLGSENTHVFMNGAPMNDIESGRPYWGSWGGLNDVMRNNNNLVGIAPSDFGIGGIGGVSFIDSRASRQRQQTRISYARSNRSYNNRIMATHSTGMLPSGWAFSFSASKRWAEEGYVPGTFYDAYSYYLSVEKQINNKHSISFTGLGAPNRRGRNIASIQEMYDLSGSNFYNPWWGYQNGKKRNARVSEFHQPLGILTHDWKINKSMSLLSAVSYQNGRGGSTAIDWFDAQNPNPDYYRNAIAYWSFRTEQSADRSVLDELDRLYRENEDARQIDWAGLYEANRNFYDTVEDVDGVEGNSVSGNRAAYLLEDRRYDSEKFNFNTVLEAVVNEGLTLHGGVTYQYFKGHNFKVLEDLLGADFHVNVDQFAARDSLQNEDFIQNDLNNPNQIVREGDIFGYNYYSYIHQTRGWLTANTSSTKVDAFIGLEFSNTRFWREGKYRNGRFPNSSFGESERQKFNNAGIKAGLTYKLDGRNYLFLNAGYLTRAPFFRNAYVSPRTRDQVVPGLQDEKIFGLEGGYFLRSPYAKARVVAYYNSFQDQFFNRSLLVEFTDVVSNTEITAGGETVETVTANSTRGFGNYIMTGINTRHAGIELAGEVQVATGLRVNAVVALGNYIYTNNPQAFVSLDNEPDQLRDVRRVYLKGYKIAGTPQMAGTVGLRYNSAKYWFASVNFNYIDGAYIEPFPDFRTIQAVSITDDPTYQQQAIEPGSDLWNSIIAQKQGDAAFSVDLFGGKSWKIDRVFIYLTVGINNLLDDQDFITGGFEQFDLLGRRASEKRPDVRPARYFYGFGRNFFTQVALRF